FAGIAQRIGERLKRIVKGERQIPGLCREDHQDRRELETDVAGGEERHQPQHEAGQEPEHGDALEDVEHRQQHPLGGPRFGRRPAVAEREEVRDHERDHAAGERVQRVSRECGGTHVDLHRGPGADYAYLLPQYDRLAHGRALLFYDQRGGGRSPVARDVPVGWQEHVADLDALRKHWAIDRLALLGYSWGGLLAVLYALEYSDRVGRLALVAPAPLTARWREEFERRLSARLADPRIVRARAELPGSGLAQRDPEKYRCLAFALSVAGYFKDPSRAKELTPFRVVARTQQAVWQSL